MIKVCSSGYYNNVKLYDIAIIVYYYYMYCTYYPSMDIIEFLDL